MTPLQSALVVAIPLVVAGLVVLALACLWARQNPTARFAPDPVAAYERELQASYAAPLNSAEWREHVATASRLFAAMGPAARFDAGIVATAAWRESRARRADEWRTQETARAEAR